MTPSQASSRAAEGDLLASTSPGDARRSTPLTRRRFLAGAIGSTAVALLAACAPAAAPAPTAAPAAKAPAAPAAAPTTAPAAAAPTSAPAAVPTTAPAVSGAAAQKASAPTAQPVAKIKRGGTLRTHEQLKPTLDPHVSASHWVASMYALYDSLTYNYLDKAKGTFEIRPMLAESWQRSGDSAYVFKLRQGVKFHDGSDWNAEVAKWNLDRLKTHAKSVSKDIVAIIDSVSVVDPYTINIQTKGPSASLPAVLSAGVAWGRTRMVSKAAVEKLGDEGFGNTPSGTGPFMLDKWVKDDQLVLKRNPNYWRKGADGQSLPYLDSVVYRFVPDDATRLAELRSGGLEVTYIAAKDLSIVQKESSLVYWQQPWRWSSRCLGLNAKEGPFVDNLKLRQAFAHSLDHDALVKALTFGAGDTDRYVWSKGQMGYDSSIPVYEYNPDKAKQLLKEAGYANGLEVRTLTFTIPEYLKDAETFQAMLAKTGFRMVIDSLERLAWIAKAQTFKGWEIAFWGWGSVAEPDAMSRNLVSTGLGNWTGVVNKERDELMAQGRAEFDTQKRHETYKKVQQNIYEEAHLIFGHRFYSNTTYQKHVQGLTTEWDETDLVEVWLDK